MTFQNEKTPFQAIKRRSLKSRKIDIFLKGLTQGFGQKMVIFSNRFFFQNLGQEIVFYAILERKNAWLGYKKKVSKIEKLIDGFGPKMAIFLNFFFYAIQATKISFMIFQNKNTPFQAIKTRSLKRPKIDIFPKGLTQDFGLKMAIFLNFFFYAIQATKMSFMIF